MTDRTADKNLWTPRSVEDTVEMYGKWAKTYDDDILASGYVTPQRVAEALVACADLSDQVLDFGCGTGLSGLALRDAGFKRIDGTDITPEMLDIASQRGVYTKTWLSDPAMLSIAQNQYQVICAAGVISLGAGPPEMLSSLLGVLPKSGHLGFSFNDPTLADRSYQDAVDELVNKGHASIAFRQYGPHLSEKNMASDVIVLRRS